MGYATRGWATPSQKQWMIVPILSLSPTTMDRIRRNIADLSSLLAALEYYRHEKIDVAPYMRPGHLRPDNAGFLQSLAKVLSTVENAVSVTGGLKTSGHLQLVIAVEADHQDSGLSRSDSEITLVGTPESKKTNLSPISDIFSYTSNGHDTITRFIRTHLTPQKLNRRDNRLALVKERVSEMRQKIVASDLLFPYHTGGFREIFCAWRGTNPSRDYALLPKEGITFHVKPSMGAFIAQIVVGVWDATTRSMLFTNANLPRWINGLGLLLGYACLTFGNPAADVEEVFFLAEAIHVLKGLFASEHLKLVFTKSSLATQLKTSYETSQSIGPKDVEVHESYPLPSCLQRLVINYLTGIVEVVVHAKHIYHHRLHMDASLPPDQDIDDLIVDAIYLNMDDPLSEPVSSLEDILCRFIPDLDEEEIWFKTRREQLQAYVSAAVHPEAAITCLKRVPEAVLTSELKIDAQTVEIVSKCSALTEIGMSRKMCYCCAVVEAWTLQESGMNLDGMDPRRSHGRIVPWLPPRYGLSMEKLEALKGDLVGTLKLLVKKLREDDSIAGAVLNICKDIGSGL